MLFLGYIGFIQTEDILFFHARLVLVVLALLAFISFLLTFSLITYFT